MIDLAHNITAFFGETGENTGIHGLLSRLRERERIPHYVVATPDLFYAVADALPESEVRPMRLDADGAIALSDVPKQTKKTELFVVSTANIETGILTPTDKIDTDAEIIWVETIPNIADEEMSRSARDRIETAILARFPFARRNGTVEKRLANVSRISFENMNGDVIASMLFDKGFLVSTGCACADVSKRPSMTLREMNVPYSRVIGSLHFSFGDGFGRPDADNFISSLGEVIEHVREISF